MHLCRRNEVKICEKVLNNLGKLKKRLPRRNGMIGEQLRAIIRVFLLAIALFGLHINLRLPNRHAIGDNNYHNCTDLDPKQEVFQTIN